MKPPIGFVLATHNNPQQNYIHPAWITLAFERYMAIGFGFYKIAKRFKWKRRAVYMRSNFLIEKFTPFHGSVRCYAGDHWLTGNRRTASAMLASNAVNTRLIEHFSRRPVPDEGLFQSLICNAPDLKISQDNKRFTDWKGCTNHPRLLTEAEFPALLSSSDYFPRKFAFDPEALLRLNNLVDEDYDRVLKDGKALQTGGAQAAPAA